MAYLLRQYPEHTVASALSLIRESRPIAEPNDGFMAQLELYKEMGCPRDIDAHPRYQRWLYRQEVDVALAAGMAPERIRFEDEETQEGGVSEGNQVELRCRKCRPKNSPHTITKVSNRLARPPPDHIACTHHFLHPLSWMRPALDQGLLNGRLECPNPKCLAQIGRYAWQGMRCNCGVWVLPAFSLQKGRVDEITKRAEKVPSQGAGKDGFGGASPGAAEESGGIRLPPGMRGKGNL
ncbi:Tyrosine-protein phosphatase [Lachnellula occidentalis]|uniref:protein-tyrosine-phosphatase n=1 Tax=Lachnellula occidentalis TaxID=215460 RepID=A0A8H8UK95_9HELO|nr:Tyrosine-protein phosphatase [Lachnellula occidentalis]